MTLDRLEEIAAWAEKYVTLCKLYGTTEDKADYADLARCARALIETKKLVLAYGDNNEGTSWPWWAVVAKNRMGPSAILAGPFFSRERAEQHRKTREYEYGKGSIVYCFSGYHSHHYRDLIEAVEAAGGGE